MKSDVLFIITLFFPLFFYGCEKEAIVKETELPAAAQAFLTQHFPNTSIATVIEEKEVRTTTYEVVLKDGTTLDFTENGDCTEMDGHMAKLPDSVIPPRILTYVQTNYATDYIVSWEKDGSQQDIELASKLELKFDKDGNFRSWMIRELVSTRTTYL